MVKAVVHPAFRLPDAAGESAHSTDLTGSTQLIPFADPESLEAFASTEAYAQTILGTGNLNPDKREPQVTITQQQLKDLLDKRKATPARHWHTGLISDLRIWNPDGYKHNLPYAFTGGRRGSLGGMVVGVLCGAFGGLFGSITGGPFGGLIGYVAGTFVRPADFDGRGFGGGFGGSFGADFGGGGFGGSFGGGIFSVGTALAITYAITSGQPGLGLAGAAASFMLGAFLSWAIPASVVISENKKAIADNRETIKNLNAQIFELESQMKQVSVSATYTEVAEQISKNPAVLRAYLDKFVRGKLNDEYSALKSEQAQLRVQLLQLLDKHETRSQELKSLGNPDEAQVVRDVIAILDESIAKHETAIFELERRLNGHDKIVETLSQWIAAIDVWIDSQSRLEGYAKDIELARGANAKLEFLEQQRFKREQELQSVLGTAVAGFKDLSAHMAANHEVLTQTRALIVEADG